MNLNKKIQTSAKDFDLFAKKYLSSRKESSILWKAMNYGVTNGGKRIRPFLIIELSKLLKIKKSQYMKLALAAEFVHSYSLIHDDLPGMDNDDLRRGKLTTHKKYGEASAVLAGNSLLTLAFEIIADKKYVISPNQKNDLIEFLAFCSGHTGIAGGQELDLKFENKKKSLNQILIMQTKKTGKLFNFCLYAVGVLAKKNNREKFFLSILGEEIGLLFQLADDFLDIKGNKKLVGKPINKDGKKGKSTLINLMGYKKAHIYANNLKKKILLKLKKHGKKGKDLSDVIHFILGRNF